MQGLFLKCCSVFELNFLHQDLTSLCFLFVLISFFRSDRHRRNTKSLKGMPFRFKTHQIYFSREKFLSAKTPRWECGGVQMVMRGRTRHPHSRCHSTHLFSPLDLSTNTLRIDDRARTGWFDSPSLTKVGALDDPKVTLAAEGARGEIGEPVRGGAFFLVPHHCHHAATVQAVHGEVPEALLLEGQGRGRG